MAIAAYALSASEGWSEESFVDMDLDALMQLDITSVARRPMSAEDTAAASFVITQDDIRRTGAATVPELLRLVPGFEVADIDNSYSAVAARGFNWRSSNKLLILIDGRSIYRSALLGVLWDQQVVAVEEIERIEVLRGPGAALWGANAVNGVVNIVTKHAVDTLGGKGVVRYGSDGSGRFYLRQGLRLGENGAMRLYAAGLGEPSLEGEDGSSLTEDARGGQIGFRIDWEPNARDAFTLQGDAIDFQSAQSLSFFAPGGPGPSVREESVLGDSVNVLGRWVRTFGDESGLNVQFYFDQFSRQEVDETVVADATTYSFEATNYFPLASNYRAMWGVGVNHSDVSATSSGDILVTGTEIQDTNFFGFLHNDIELFDRRLMVSAGVRLEYNERTDWQAHPNLRALWRAPDDWRLWAAISRATRTPALNEAAGSLNLGGFTATLSEELDPIPALLSLQGNPNIRPEPLVAFELGARKKWPSGTSLDIALYAHRYTDLIDLNLEEPQLLIAPVGPGGAPVPVAIDVSATFANRVDARLYGIEAAFDARLTDFWRIRLAGDARHFPSLAGQVAQIDDSPTYLARRSPVYQAQFQSHFDITQDLDASLWVRRTGRILDTDVDAQTVVDLRVGWRPTETVEVTLLGEGLNNRRRPVASDLDFLPATRGFSERRISLQLGIRF